MMKHPIFAVSTCLIWMLPVAAQTPAGHDESQSHAGHSHAARQDRPEKDESNLDYFWRKSDEAFHNGDYERAVGLHRAIVAIDPTDTQSFGVAAWLLWSLGRGDEAIAHLRRGLAANPDNATMWDEAGQHFDLQKKRPEAQEAYARAVQSLPKDEDSQMLRRRLAHAAEKNGDFALSLQTWRDLARDFPNEAVNKNNLARVEKLRGGTN